MCKLTLIWISAWLVMMTMANGVSPRDSPDNDYNGAEQPPYTVIQKYEVNYEPIKPRRIVDNGSLMSK